MIEYKFDTQLLIKGDTIVTLHYEYGNSQTTNSSPNTERYFMNRTESNNN